MGEIFHLCRNGVSEKITPIYRGNKSYIPYMYAINHSTFEQVIQGKNITFNLKNKLAKKAPLKKWEIFLEWKIPPHTALRKVEGLMFTIKHKKP